MKVVCITVSEGVLALMESEQQCRDLVFVSLSSEGTGRSVGKNCAQH